MGVVVSSGAGAERSVASKHDDDSDVDEDEEEEEEEGSGSPHGHSEEPALSELRHQIDEAIGNSDHVFVLRTLIDAKQSDEAASLGACLEALTSLLAVSPLSRTSIYEVRPSTSRGS